MKACTSALLATIILASILSLQCAKKTDHQSESIPVISVPDKTERWAEILVGSDWNNYFGIEHLEYVSYFVYNGTPFEAHPEINDKDELSHATVKRFVDGAWQFVGQPGFTQGDVNDISLFVYGGIPYMSCDDSKIGRCVMKFDGARWNVIAGSPCDKCGSASLFVRNDTLYIAAVTIADTSTKSIIFVKYNKSSWQTVAEVPTSKRISHLSLDISNGVPYIAYSVKKGILLDSGTVDVIKYDGKNLVTVGDTGIFIGARYNISISTLHGVPYLSTYSSLLTNSLTEHAGEVKRFNGKTWEPVVVPNSAMGKLVRISVNDTLFPAGMTGGQGSTSVYFVCTEADSGKITRSAMQPPPVWKSWKSWRYIGDPGFANPRHHFSFSVDHGIPYVAFIDADSKKLSVMKYGQNEWEHVGNLNITGESTDFSLIVYNDTPFVAFSDNKNSNKATVLKYNGNKWETVGKAGLTDGEAGSLSIFIKNSTPFLAFADKADSGRVSVMKYSGTDWVPIGKRGFSVGYGQFISLFVYNDMPFVAYGDGGNAQKATVMKFNGTDWEPVGVPGFSAGIANDISFFVYEGTPYVAYIDCENSYRVTVRKYLQNSWKTLGDSAISAGEASRVSLYIDKGTLYVSYTDVYSEDLVGVRKYTGSSWEIVGWNGILSGTSTLRVNDGIPYVACAGDSGLTVMMYK